MCNIKRRSRYVFGGFAAFVGLLASLLALGVPIPTIVSLKESLVAVRECRTENLVDIEKFTALLIDDREYRVMGTGAVHVPMYFFRRGRIDVDVRCNGSKWKNATLEVTLTTCRVVHDCA